MKNKSLIFVSFIFIVLNLLFVSGLEFEQNAFVNLKAPCTIDGKNCNTSVVCNISITYPKNGSFMIENQLMTNTGNGMPNITLNDTSILGNYKAPLSCCFNDICDKGNADFEITPNGEILSLSGAIVYVILAFGVLLLFVISFYFMIVTPYSNNVNERGAVIQVTRLKYVKLGLILLTWVSLTWFLNILIGLSDNFVSLTMYYGFFGFVFETMNRLALPLGIFIMVLSFFEIIRDANIHENIKKFGSALK